MHYEAILTQNIAAKPLGLYINATIYTKIGCLAYTLILEKLGGIYQLGDIN